ncbi:MAG: agmatine/peptidylarginine deiminase [Hormoscilla sp.]
MFDRRKFLKYSMLGTMATLGSNGLYKMESMRANEGTSMPNYRRLGTTLIENSTPKSDGFFFPAEWEPHEFTIMAFPPPQNWAGYGLADARRDWSAIANVISEFEPVLMVVRPQDRSRAKRRLNSDIELVEFPLNDGWTRDSGPIILVNESGERRVPGFTFNGWGEKLPPYNKDALLKARLCNYLDLPMYPVDLVLEGGAVATDGQGTILTTEECLLNSNRNPGMTQAQVEQFLLDYLGAEKVIWLARGITPDPITDGHVDGICAFAAPGVVLLHTTDDRNDPNFEIGNDAKSRLEAATDAQGRSLEVIEVPLALDVPHMNFYICNGGVIVPIANDPAQDDEPMAILREVFSDRQVVGVNGQLLAQGGGGAHCITQQVPLARTRRSSFRLQ